MPVTGTPPISAGISRLTGSPSYPVIVISPLTVSYFTYCRFGSTETADAAAVSTGADVFGVFPDAAAATVSTGAKASPLPLLSAPERPRRRTAPAITAHRTSGRPSFAASGRPPFDFDAAGFSFGGTAAGFAAGGAAAGFSFGGAAAGFVAGGATAGSRPESRAPPPAPGPWPPAALFRPRTNRRWRTSRKRRSRGRSSPRWRTAPAG